MIKNPECRGNEQRPVYVLDKTLHADGSQSSSPPRHRTPRMPVKAQAKMLSVLGILALAGSGLVGVAAAPSAIADPDTGPQIGHRIKPGKSKTARPEKIAGAKKATTVNTLVTDNFGNLTLVKQRTTNRAQTLTTIASAQKQSDTVAVGVEHKVHLTPATTGAAETKDVAASSTNDPWAPGQWAITDLDYDGLANLTTGAGRTVAVVDTGVDAAHPDLAGNLLPGQSFVPGSPAPVDDNGHGTHVSGIIAARRNNGIGTVGIAPNAKILPVKVLDASGSGTTSGVVNGILWAAGRNVDAINLSLGSTEDDDVLRTAVQYAVNRGTAVVAAVGNDRTSGSPVMFPAAYSEVIAVSAVNYYGDIASFSSVGSYVDVAAPGEDIVSSWPGGGVQYASGTSMAAPHVAGLIADLRALKPNATVAQLKSALENTALDRGDWGFDTDHGHGLIVPVAAAAATNLLVTPPRAVPPVSTAYTTTTTITFATPVLGRIGQTERVYATVRRTDNGAPVPGSRVTLYVAPPEGSGPTATYPGTTGADGAASWDIPVTTTLRFYASTFASVGVNYGSDDLRGVSPGFKQTISARARKHRLVLGVSDTSNRAIRVDQRRGGRWVKYRRSTIGGAGRLKLAAKKKYRVCVSGYSALPAACSNIFKG